MTQSPAPPKSTWCRLYDRNWLLFSDRSQANRKICDLRKAKSSKTGNPENETSGKILEENESRTVSQKNIFTLTEKKKHAHETGAVFLISPISHPNSSALSEFGFLRASVSLW
jgi:hypothetical protein